VEFISFFADNPSNHVWCVICLSGYDESRLCSKKYSMIHLLATSDDAIEGSESGLEAHGLTDNTDDMTVNIDSYKPGKSDMSSLIQ